MALQRNLLIGLVAITFTATAAAMWKVRDAGQNDISRFAAPARLNALLQQPADAAPTAPATTTMRAQDLAANHKVKSLALNDKPPVAPR